jgi:hypothetical protein
MSGAVVHEADEGTLAHLWQLLAGQIPVLAFFAIKWLPRAPTQTLCPRVANRGGARINSPRFFPPLVSRQFGDTSDLFLTEPVPAGVSQKGP